MLFSLAPHEQEQNISTSMFYALFLVVGSNKPKQIA
jgi:hypothetical protein